MTDEEQASSPPRRIESLDQFRGYTVVAMLAVNFLGGFAVIPAILKHHNTYCSYADTVMPQFFFAVGFAYRLTMLRRVAKQSARAAYRHAVGRIVGLLVLGFIIYHLDGKFEHWDDLKSLGVLGVLKTAFQKEYFQTLVHIALASIWVLPVITRGPGVRLVWLVGSAAIHLGLSSWWYFDWLMRRSVIDGGPLGFLSWSIPLLVGTFAYDLMASRKRSGPGVLLIAAIALMAIGYGLTGVDGIPDALPFCPPTAPVNIWTMCQRSASVSYELFAAGFSLAVYLAFVVISDTGGHRLALFRTFGQNALAAYILHGWVADAVKPYTPRDVPGWYLALAFAAYFGLCTLLIRTLEKNEIFLKL
jgi:predicted acyltransferase